MNYEYKKGDPVLHRPSGCVGMFEDNGPANGAQITVLIHDTGGNKIVVWYRSNCEPYRDPAPVIEAFKEIKEMAISAGRPEDVEPASIVHFVADKLNALESYEGLYRDSCEETEAYKMVLRSIADMNSPFMAKDIQLPINMAKGVLAEYEEKPDESKTERPIFSNPWITDRNPTKEDCFNQRIFIYAPSSFFDAQLCVLESWNGEPWQPIPECLREEPDQRKCEDCQCHSLYKTVEEYGEGKILSHCSQTRLFNPRYGMDGCEFKVKVDK